ncbi:MAG TPA: ABC transporter ATP-binding protein [Actinomycetes bacterium]|jgi:branched-chain amino acid transport system ATP-binding protein|nr:ABC transporter ATP-binding protein [Actinomycetes bacterium]
MLSVEDVHCSYGNARVLAGVSLEVAAGEVVTLLGRNGMGKTSLVRTVAGMRPPTLREGRVVLRDEDISRRHSHEIARRGVGIVPQGRHIFGSLSVRENLTVAARPPSDDRREPWTLERVFEFFPRLAERVGSRGSDLSGGEQQMLAIGRALMTNPDLLLMDEPSEGLAPIVVRQIREHVQALKRQRLSILLVEQNLGFALSCADRIYVLGEGGMTVWAGTPAELNVNEEAKRTHLGI